LRKTLSASTFGVRSSMIKVCLLAEWIQTLVPVSKHLVALLSGFWVVRVISLRERQIPILVPFKFPKSESQSVNCDSKQNRSRKPFIGRTLEHDRIP